MSELITSAGALGFALGDVPLGDRDRVAALIPSRVVADAYIGRDLHGVRDFDVFAAALRDRDNVALFGPTQAGKTLAARAFAAAHGLPFYSIPVNGGVDPSTLWGVRDIVEGDTTWTDSEGLLVIRYGGVLVFDELNMAPSRIMASTFGLLDDRRSVTLDAIGGAVVRAAASLLIIATYNPGYDGTGRLNEALRDRFTLGFNWDYERDVESALVDSPSLIEFAWNVRALDEVRTPLSTAALVTFAANVERFGMTFARGVLLDRFAMGERPGIGRALELVSGAIASELAIGYGEV